ncbi:hypothetical protein E2562_033043 [Oryza meyeriana var. granulata]|uniref:Uncharacterized protein n=1 Tax=Oryza meyeriana var. granulata TaxID=110450 RepID=A0A6G1CKA6_9ORYZ|nr:hypothetical protein E2562_033043 [Oryza meyeriana var. granulata]
MVILKTAIAFCLLSVSARARPPRATVFRSPAGAPTGRRPQPHERRAAEAPQAIPSRGCLPSAAVDAEEVDMVMILLREEDS